MTQDSLKNDPKNSPPPSMREERGSPAGGGETPHPDPNIIQEKMIVQALAKVADSRLTSLLGKAIIVFCFIGAILAWKWDGALYDRKGCVTLQSIEGRIFRINSCDGEWEEIPSKPEASLPKVHR